jgi:hypothetical protein
MITDEIKINEKSMTIDEIGPNFVWQLIGHNWSPNN